MPVNVNELPVRKQFNRRLIAEDTWIINPFAPNVATPRPYLVEGEDYALVLDTTYTMYPLREYIETCVTSKPLKVASTHSHGDHTNANFMFNDCEIFMSEYAFDEIRERRQAGIEGGRWYLVDCENRKHPMTEDQIGDYTPTILRPGGYH